MAKKTKPNDPRDYFVGAVTNRGGPAAASRYYGIPFTTIASICSGQKGVGPRTARRMVEVDPMLDEGKLMLVRAVG